MKIFFYLFIITAFSVKAQDYQTEKRMSKPFKKAISLKKALKNPLEATQVNILNYSDSIFPNEEIMKLKNVEYISVEGRFVKYKIKDVASPPVKIRIDTARMLRLTKLTCINFHNFDFSVFPEEICYVKQLKGLAMSICLIKNISPKISKLTNLTFLELRLNELNSLPDELSDMENLEVLDLANNLFTLIPEKIGRLKSLRTFTFGNYEVFKSEPNGHWTWPYPFNINKVDYNSQYSLLKSIISNPKLDFFQLSVTKCGDKTLLAEKLMADGLYYKVFISKSGCE